MLTDIKALEADVLYVYRLLFSFEINSAVEVKIWNSSEGVMNANL